ncbi:hypothetical protein BWQ92_15310 [Arthrobacter sp. QXT-31]|nr:hypothetical protein BWQ92_15310 [Arthrobacter sp. QXT-31]
MIIAMNAFRPGGSQTYAFALARMLDNHGIEPVLVAKPGPWYKEAKLSARSIRVMWREGTATGGRNWVKKIVLRALEAASARRLATVANKASLIVTSQPGPTAFFAEHSDRQWPAVKRMALVHGTTQVEWPFRDHTSTMSRLAGLLAATSETSKFLKIQSPNTPVEEIGNIFRAEMYWGDALGQVIEGYDPNGPVIFLGTLTPNKTAPLSALFVAVADLGLELIVVGGGPQESELRQSVQEQGFQTNITFVGAVTDPRPWITRASVVVTAGRGAIECMAAGRPTIVATSEGTHGLATLSNLDELQSYNFTGRTPSSTQPTPGKLTQAVTEARRLDPHERCEIAEAMHEVGTIAPIVNAVHDRS